MRIALRIRLGGLLAAAVGLLIAGSALADMPTRPGPDGSKAGVDASGGLTISVPLPAPPGINGAAPELSLGYSSAAGDGVIGVGWRLEGLSQIQRCPAIPAADGVRGAVTFGAGDRFCLDGARLIAVSGAYGSPGSVYRTEVETWRKVTASADQCGAGPCSFTVQERDGKVLVFGGTPQSRPLAGQGPAVRSWLLSSQTDANGNSIAYAYDASDGAARLVSASYGTNTGQPGIAADRAVLFGYEARPDPITNFVGGVSYAQPQRLKTVTTTVDGAAVLTFTLQYVQSAATGRSLLTSVQRCSPTQCLAPMSVQWQGQAAASFQNYGLSMAAQGSDVRLRSADMNGDGFGDLMAVEQGSSLSVTPMIYDRRSSFTACPSLTLPPGDPADLVVGDFNADGFADLAQLNANGQLLEVDVYLGQADGCSLAAQPSVDVPLGANPPQHWAADVNGDGMTDIVLGYPVANGIELDALVSTGTGFQAPASSTLPLSGCPAPGCQTDLMAEVNGDGMLDFVRMTPGGSNVPIVYVALSTGGSFAPPVETDLSSVALVDVRGAWPLDVNRDGLDDLVVALNGANGAMLLAPFFADGAGGFQAGPTTQTTSPLSQGTLYLGPVDTTGAGTPAMLHLFGSGGAVTATVIPAVAGKFGVGAQVATQFVSQQGAPILPLDFSGDGKADLIQLTSGSGQLTIAGLLNAGEPADLADGFVDAMGGTVTAAYAPLSDPTVYTRNPSAGTGSADALGYAYRMAPGSEPYLQVSGGVRAVVKALTRSGGPTPGPAAYSYAEGYSYAGGLIDLGGRGWLGFAWVSRFDADLGRTTQTSYGLPFPYTGTAASVLVSCAPIAGGDPNCVAPALLSRTTNTYAAVVTAQGTSGGVVDDVRLAGVEVDTLSYGNPDFTRIRTYGYDDFGNVLVVEDKGITQGAGATTADDVWTCQSYANSADTWILGLVTARKMSSSAACDPAAPFAASDVHAETWSYDAAGNVLSYGIYDDGNGLVLTTSYAVDAFGNPVSATLPGGSTTRIAYETAFNTYPQTVTTPPDSGGTSTVVAYGYDPRFGGQTAKQLADGSLFVDCLDDLGDHAARQGPPPGPGAWALSQSCLAAGTTGASGFASSALITVSSTTRSLDGGGRYVEETSSLQDWTAPGGKPVTVWRRSYRDGSGREYMAAAQSAANPAGVVVCSVFNSDDQAARTSLPTFAGATSCDTAQPAEILWSTQQSDAAGRPLQLLTPTDASGQAAALTTYRYQPGLIATVAKGAPGQALDTTQVTAGYFNGQRKIVSISTPSEGATTTYGYGPTGELTSVLESPTASNPNGIANTTRYDSVGRIVRLDNPDLNPGGVSNGALTKAYGANGLLVSQTDAKGQVTKYSYDPRRRMIGRADPSYVVVYGYDDPSLPGGRDDPTSIVVTTAAGAPVSTETRAYDPYGNVVQRTVVIGPDSFTLKQSYGPQGDLVSETYPDGTVVSRTYASGLPATITAVAGTTTAKVALGGYTPLKLPQTITYGPGAKSSIGYSAVGTPLTEQMTDPSGARLLDLELQWDGLFNLASKTDKLQPGGVSYSETYGYSAERLTAASAPGLYGQVSYAYDQVGNQTQVNGLARTYQAHRVTNLTNADGSVWAVDYDGDGNVVRRGPTAGPAVTYAYDARNQLLQLTGPDGAVFRNTAYTDDGRRLVRVTADGTVTLFPFPNYRVVRTPSLGERRTVYLTVGARTYAALDSTSSGPGAVLYLHADQVGSSTLVLDGDGKLVARYAYLPFGADSPAGVSGPDATDRRFQGRTLDAQSQVYDFGARYYDPAIGRFLTADSRPADDLFTRDVLNRYALALNNPVTLSDPTGHNIFDQIAGALVGVAEVVAGVALDVVSDGALEPIGQGLIAGGINSVQYSATAGSSFNWKEFGEQDLVGFALGSVTSGLGEAGLAGKAAVDVTEESATAVSGSVARDVAQDAEGRAVTAEADSAASASADEAQAGREGLDTESCSAASLPAGQLVLTAAGPADISGVRAGDLVTTGNAIDFSRPSRPVIATLSRTVDALTELVVAYGGGRTETLLITPEHPVATVERGWLNASDLRGGMRLRSAGGGEVEVVSNRPVELAHSVRVFNLSVRPEHSYFIGDSGVWVHNPCQAIWRGHAAYDVELRVPSAEYPESALHIADAQNAGHPDVLTIARGGARQNRYWSLRGIARIFGFDRDEYPPAMFAEGGAGASVRPLTPWDNRAAGSSFGGQLRGYADGTRVWFRVI